MPRANGSSLIGLLTAIWRARFGKMLHNTLPSLALLAVCLAFVSCSQHPQPTEDPHSSVVKLRNDLINFAKGNLDEIIGHTEPEESYILIFGYPERQLDSLPISETLQKKLNTLEIKFVDILHYHC